MFGDQWLRVIEFAAFTLSFAHIVAVDTPSKIPYPGNMVVNRLGHRGIF